MKFVVNGKQLPCTDNSYRRDLPPGLFPPMAILTGNIPTQDNLSQDNSS